MNTINKEHQGGLFITHLVVRANQVSCWAEAGLPPEERRLSLRRPAAHPGEGCAHSSAGSRGAAKGSGPGPARGNGSDSLESPFVLSTKLCARVSVQVSPRDRTWVNNRASSSPSSHPWPWCPHGLSKLKACRTWREQRESREEPQHF